MLKRLNHESPDSHAWMLRWIGGLLGGEEYYRIGWHEVELITPRLIARIVGVLHELEDLKFQAGVIRAVLFIWLACVFSFYLRALGIGTRVQVSFL